VIDGVGLHQISVANMDRKSPVSRRQGRSTASILIPIGLIRHPGLVVCGFACLLSSCNAPPKILEAEISPLNSASLFEASQPGPIPIILTSMRKIHARTCRYLHDQSAEKLEILASLRRQALAKGANGVVGIRYKEFSYNSRGPCRPGLVAVGTPVIFRVDR
jgi:uncharacterized protein YbjQ (UPF0145 family)